MFPGLTLSGSSEAGLSAAKTLGAIAIKYPKPAGDYKNELCDTSVKLGIRVGIIAREDEQAAWKVAYERFPVDRKGQLTHQLAMRTSDSEWHRQLSELGREAEQGKNPYWLVPFENYKTFSPYLVGTYETVARELAGYIEAGFETFLLDVPANEEELRRIRIVFDRASEQVAK